jgi:hypothetical protein
MARLSGWQNFAKNFKSTKEVFDDLFTAVETKKIMDEEVEVIRAPDAGLSHHAAGPTKWSYGGKTYDKEITPAMLTGLRNTRLSDVATRYGDAEGAMKMRIDQATLRGLDDQHALDSGTLAERIRAVKLDNDQKMKSMDLTTAEINKINRLAPLEASKLIAEIAEQKRSTAEKTAKMPDELAILSDKADTSRVVLDEFTSDLATENREGGLKQTKAEQLNEKKRLELEKKKLELEGKILDSTYDNELATALFNSGQVKNEAEAAEMASKISLQGNKTLTEFATKMGNKEFENAEAQKAWLLDAWDDTHDPRVKAMIEGIDAMELSQLTAEGTKTMTEINNALSGKGSNAAKAALIKVIDKQDGIEGNMKFGKDGKGNTVLYEYPSAEAMEADKDGTGTGGEAVVTGHGVGWTKFTESLYAEFTPLKSLEIAKANADIRKANAEAKYNEGRVGEAQSAAQLEQWSKHKDSETYRVEMDKARAAHQKSGSKEPFDLAKWQEEYKNNWLADYPVIPEGVQVVETSGIGTK